jgi:RNA polymerase sigma-32 factor
MSSETYINTIAKTPLLTEKEEKQLTEEYAATKSRAAHDKLVTHNLRLVLKAAHKYDLTRTALSDLLQEGSIGLMMGVQAYDPSRGVRFGNYAYYWIKAYILRYVVNNARQVKIGTTQAQRKLFFNLAKTKAELANLGIVLSDEDLADKMEVKVEELREMEQRMFSPAISLDIHHDEDSHHSRGNYIERNRSDIVEAESCMPNALLEEKEFNLKLRNLLDTFATNLPKRERSIFERRLLCDEKDTLETIGDEFGVTKERIRQIELSLIDRLGKMLKRNNMARQCA